VSCAALRESELFLDKDILTAGYTVLQCKQAGFSASQVRHALPMCVSATALAKQKYSLVELVMLKQWLETE
jgi:hypothetical protein